MNHCCLVAFSAVPLWKPDLLYLTKHMAGVLEVIFTAALLALQLGGYTGKSYFHSVCKETQSFCSNNLSHLSFGHGTDTHFCGIALFFFYLPMKLQIRRMTVSFNLFFKQ